MATNDRPTNRVRSVGTDGTYIRFSTTLLSSVMCGRSVFCLPLRVLVPGVWVWPPQVPHRTCGRSSFMSHLSSTLPGE
jgi:hypothetical protein